MGAEQQIGINLSPVNFYNTEYPFLDRMKAASNWLANTSKPITYNQYGYPSAVPDGQYNVYKLVGMDPATSDTPHTYVLSYTGTANILLVGATVISNDPGRIVFSYENPDSTQMLLLASGFDGTSPLSSISIVRTDQEALFKTGEIFNPDFTSKIAPFDTLRYMDWSNTNGSTVTTWASRTTPSSQTWQGTEDNSVPLEVMVALANETHTNMWLNVPAMADDDYVRQMMTYVRDHLDPTLTVRLEYSNEVWNFSFSQADYAMTQGEKLWDKDANGDGVIDLTDPAEHNGGDWVLYQGYRAAQVANIANQVFAGDDRLRNVLSTQTAYLGIENYILDGVLRANVGSVSSLFKDYAITAYSGDLYGGTAADQATILSWAHSGAAGVDAAFQALKDGTGIESFGSMASLLPIYAYQAAVAAKEGLSLVAYEGGIGLFSQNFQAADVPDLIAFFTKLDADPRMGDLYKQMVSDFAAAGGTLLNDFNDAGVDSVYGTYGVLKSIYDTGSPRYDALVAAANAARGLTGVATPIMGTGTGPTVSTPTDTGTGTTTPVATTPTGTGTTTTVTTPVVGIGPGTTTPVATTPTDTGTTVTVTTPLVGTGTSATTPVATTPTDTGTTVMVTTPVVGTATGATTPVATTPTDTGTTVMVTTPVVGIGTGTTTPAATTPTDTGMTVSTPATTAPTKTAASTTVATPVAGLGTTTSTVSLTLGAMNTPLAAGTTDQPSYVFGAAETSVTYIGTGVFTAVGNDLGVTITAGDGGSHLTGGAGTDTLIGGASDDYLDGGSGGDRMVGGAGNDTYVVDDYRDQVFEMANGGTDTIHTSLSAYVMPDNVENLTYTGSGGFQAVGNAFDNAIIGGPGPNRLMGGAGSDTLTGGSCDDVLDGGTGADTMTGGAGDDIYFVDNVGDVVVEKPGEGTDTIYSTVSYTLSDNVENLTLMGSGPISGTGNALDNIIFGNNGGDHLLGGGGNDTLMGGAGNDVLEGGFGADILTGGGGADRFVFRADDLDANPTKSDTITDFSHADGDKIDLTAFETSAMPAFSFIGTAAFGHHAGELRINVNPTSQVIYGDLDGDGVADFSITLTKSAGMANLITSDFVL